MTFKSFIQLTLLSTFVIWGIWIFFIFTVDPVFAGLFEFSLFYLALFMAIAGTILSIAVAMRVTFHPNVILFRHVLVSFRQAVLLAGLVVGSLILLSQNLLSWWTMLFFVTILSLIEWNAESLARKKRSIEHNNDSGDSL